VLASYGPNDVALNPVDASEVQALASQV